MAWHAGLLVLGLLIAGCGTTWSEESATWHLAEAPSGTSLEVWTEFGGSTCTRFLEWRVEETSEEVEVLAVIERSDDEICTDDLAFVEGTVHLEAPLGARELTGCDPNGQGLACEDPRPSPPNPDG